MSTIRVTKPVTVEASPYNRKQDFTIVTEVTVPPGTYVVGDPCYAVPNDRWHEWLDASDMGPVNHSREHVLCADLDGRTCVGVSTAFGDGSYPDNLGNGYGVDAGLIGLVPIELVDRETWSYAPGGWMEPVIMTFDKPVTCYYDDGTIHLGDLVIKTGDDAWDEECYRCGDTFSGYGDLCDECMDDEDECPDCGESGYTSADECPYCQDED